MKTLGYAALSADAPLAPLVFERRALRPNDVAMEILYCGVCHTDIHMARNDWGWSVYPVVPGHEIVGRVTEAAGSPASRRAMRWRSDAWSTVASIATSAARARSSSAARAIR